VSFPDIDPFVPFLHWGNFGVRWYALAYVAGILLGWRYAVMLAKNEALWGPKGPPATPAQIDDLVLWITLGVVLGGRLGYVLFYGPFQDPPIWKDPLDILKIWEGGMSFHGGLLGVLLAMWLFAKRNGASLFSIGDLVCAVVPIGLFFGRVANFINGELWGRVTDAPWGVVFCNQTIETAYGYCPAGPDPRHPSQLYEAALEGIVLFVLLRLATHRWRLLERPGAVAGLFLVGYGLFRALLETVREPDAFLRDLPLGLTMGMLLSLPMIAGGIWLLWRARREAAAAA